MNETVSIATSALAWARWETRIPAHWRPLRVQNRKNTGRITLGDSAQATVQINWWNPPRKGFSSARWMQRRLRSMRKSVTIADHAPAAERFDNTIWLPDVQDRKGVSSSIWWAYAARARLVIEVVVNTGAGPEVGDVAQDLLLPSFDASPVDAPTRWAVYDTSFESPPGYDLTDSRLNLGAITLHLRKGGQRLMLCQIYPASAALIKKPLDAWLDITGLKGKRISKAPKGDVELHVGAFDGLERASTESFPFPLGRLRRRHRFAAAVHDESLDRLLVSEYVGSPEAGAYLVREAVRTMNRAHAERRAS